MTYIGELSYHVPSDSEPGAVCLYDQERWPCTVASIRAKVAAEIVKAVQESPAHRPKWATGMTDAAVIARGPLNGYPERI